MRYLMICSKTSVEKVVAAGILPLTSFQEAVYVDRDTDYNDLPCSEEFDLVVGFGGGTALDCAKFVANAVKTPCLVIPSMLSTNVFSTNKTCVKASGVKSTADTIKPSVLVSYDILELSPKENLYGLVDVLSIFTALNDWWIARYAEPLTKEHERASKLLEQVVNTPINEYKKDWLKLYSVIFESGEITNSYGSGRPESGSEHIFSKYLEERLSIPHSVGVALGIACMSIVQKAYKSPEFHKVYRLLLDTGVFNEAKSLGVSYADVAGVLQDIKPRPDRMTVLDTTHIDVTSVMEVLKHDFKEIELL